MAKRRRLETPTSPMEIALANTAARAASAPIAQVTGEAATVAAAKDAVDEIAKLKDGGRLVISIPLDQVAVDHLERDRMATDDAEMEALRESIRIHGQRTPIEVQAIAGGGYGLISGWRRLAALTVLAAETGDAGFAEVKALIRQPQDAGAAYVTMVEENEIRVGLSFYERARIAVLAAQRGAFEDTEAAVGALYGSVSRAKRSKIRSFVAIHEALGDVLRFPQALSERFGLRLAGALKDGQGARLRDALAADPQDTAEAELALLGKMLSTKTAERPAPKDGITVRVTGKGDRRSVTLSGAGLTDALIAKIQALVE